MQKRKLILLIFAISTTVWAHQPEDGKLLASLGPFLYHSDHIQNPGMKSPTYLGGTVMLEGDIDKNGGAEISISYLQKVYATRKYGVMNIEKMKRIHITMGYRHWFNSKYSAALAFFSAYSVGQGSVIHTDYPEGLRPDSSAKDTTEYGFDFSFQHEPWASADGKFAIILDARYSMALTSKAKEDGNHFGLLTALKYEIQSN